jgi:hypothetical protein
MGRPVIELQGCPSWTDSNGSLFVLNVDGAVRMPSCPSPIDAEPAGPVNFWALGHGPAAWPCFDVPVGS